MDDKQLKKILAGHKIWLDTDTRSGERASLKGKNLKGINLRRVNLQRADLRNAVLQNANLQEANLQEADLEGADLKNADLRIAYLRLSSLRGASLVRANLRGADLWVADLSEANLREANLREANLQESNLKDAVLKDANLKFVKLTKSTYDQIPEPVKKIFANSWHVIGLEDNKAPEQHIDFPLLQTGSLADVFDDFAAALRDRFPGQRGEIRIAFQGEKIVMTVLPADGEKQTVEKHLKSEESAAEKAGGVVIDLSVEESENASTGSEDQPSPDDAADIEIKLRQLQRLYDGGLISQEELGRKRAALLDQL